MLRIVLLTYLSLTLNEVKEFFLSKGVKTKIELIDLGKPKKLGEQEAYFYLARKAFLSRAENLIVVSETFDDFTLGNTIGHFSHVAASDFNNFGEARKLHYLIALAHEYGHQRGLKHTTGCISIMDEAAMACKNVVELGFTKQELKRMR